MISLIKEQWFRGDHRKNAIHQGDIIDKNIKQAMISLIKQVTKMIS